MCHPCRNSMARYGFDSIERQILLEQQGCKCLLCQKPIAFVGDATSAVVDHCHETNKFRGIICHQCNGWLGYLETKIGFETMEKYLSSKD